MGCRLIFFVKTDDSLFLDVFSDLSAMSAEAVCVQKPDCYLYLYKNEIEKNIKDINDLKVKEKWIWLAHHFNAHLKYYKYNDWEIESINIESFIDFKINSFDSKNPWDWRNKDIDIFYNIG